MILHLRVVQGKPAGKTLVFGPGDYILGRGDECHVRFNSEWVSRQHCLLRVRDAAAVLRDLGSRNGTLINGRLCQAEQTLADGDLVQVGPVTFLVVLEPGARAEGSEPNLTLHPDSTEESKPRSAAEGTATEPTMDLDRRP